MNAIRKILSLFCMRPNKSHCVSVLISLQCMLIVFSLLVEKAFSDDAISRAVTLSAPPIQLQTNQLYSFPFTLSAPPLEGEFVEVISRTWTMLVAEVDLDGNGIIDLFDFSILSDDWMIQGSGLAGDYDGNGVVDQADLNYLTNHWLSVD